MVTLLGVALVDGHGVDDDGWDDDGVDDVGGDDDCQSPLLVTCPSPLPITSPSSLLVTAWTRLAGCIGIVTQMYSKPATWVACPFSFMQAPEVCEVEVSFWM